MTLTKRMDKIRKRQDKFEDGLQKLEKRARLNKGEMQEHSLHWRTL